jgi:hypothetical protein
MRSWRAMRRRGSIWIASTGAPGQSPLPERREVLRVSLAARQRCCSWHC